MLWASHVRIMYEFKILLRRCIKRMIVMILSLLMAVVIIMALVYSPFYSKMMVVVLKGLNPTDINPVAAQSQKQANLHHNLQQNLEPGSKPWLAHQVYLEMMWQYIQQQQAHELSHIYAGYQALLDEIEQDKTTPKTKKTAKTPSNDELKKQYRHFIEQYLKQHPKHGATNDAIFQDIAYLYRKNNQQINIAEQNKPYAIVVVGGGLTRDSKTKEIIINKYTEKRLALTLDVVKQYPLPILLSGVEAPYMQKWLQQHGVQADLLEKKSMNTCENSRFSSLLLQKKGGAPMVILITDEYHMPRTRRLFANDGIITVPIVAPMPTQRTTWQLSRRNYHHSRRANYEFLATLRDRIFGAKDCREVP